MIKRPIVSVIIPTFNRGQFIGAAIQSVINQTYDQFEIIVVDDGLTDHTSEIINSLGSDIKYIYQTNQGRSKARNVALGIATGKYIAFLDSDDLYLPNKLQLQVNYLDSHPEIGMVYTSAYCMDDNGDFLREIYDARISGRIYNQIAFFVPVTIALPTVMVRREVLDAIGTFDENMERFEDTDLWRRISKDYTIGAIGEFTCSLRTHQGNILNNQNPTKIAKSLEYYICKVRLDDVNRNRISRLKGISNLYEYYGAAMMTVPAWRKFGYVLLLKGLLSWPFNSKIINTLAIQLRRKLMNAIDAVDPDRGA